MQTIPRRYNDLQAMPCASEVQEASKLTPILDWGL